MAFPVSEKKNEELRRKMERFAVREADLEESFVRSQGPGGQNVNKTSTCVVLKHSPTGISVKCQSSRSQALNRYLARKILLDKIEAKILGRQSAEKKRIEKIRRQKRKRSKRAKEKMLQTKHLHAKKKQFRGRVTGEEE